MSNVASSAMAEKTQRKPEGILKPGPRQKAFDIGTMNILDEARAVVENAVGQGQQLNPMIYQMLGLQPQMSDHTADLQAAQQENDAARQQYDEAMKARDQLQAIPKGKRSKEQRKQLRQLNQQIPKIRDTLTKADEAFGKLQTMPKTITGFTRMDPKNIPAESPFSAQNPLFQAQATEAERLNQYLKGGEVDPTLKQEYAKAEANLRARLAQRFGPDYEGTSVGQTALQNFNREKNNAFATWNQQQVEKYNELAFSGQANLQNLLGGRIGLMREPATTAMNAGAQLSNLAGQRLHEQEIFNQWALGHGGVSSTTNPSALMPLASGAASGLTALTTPYNKAGDTLLGKAWEKTGGALYNWATGAGTAAAATGLGALGTAGATAATGEGAADIAAML